MIESGDTVKHLSNTLIGDLPMTVFEINGSRAECGYVGKDNKLVSAWYKLDELILIMKGNAGFRD